MSGCCPRRSGSPGRPSEERPSGPWPHSQVSSRPPSEPHETCFRRGHGVCSLTAGTDSEVRVFLRSSENPSLSH